MRHLLLILTLITLTYTCTTTYTPSFGTVTLTQSSSSLTVHVESLFPVLSVATQFYSGVPTVDELEYLKGEPVYEDSGVGSVELISFFDEGFVGGQTVFGVVYVRYEGGSEVVEEFVGDFLVGDELVFEVLLVDGCGSDPDQVYGNGLCCECPIVAGVVPEKLLFPHCQDTTEIVGSFNGVDYTVTVQLQNSEIQIAPVDTDVNNGLDISQFQAFFSIRDSFDDGCIDFVRVVSTTGIINAFYDDTFREYGLPCGTLVYLGLKAETQTGSFDFVGANVETVSNTACGATYPETFFSFPVYLENCCQIQDIYFPVTNADEQLELFEIVEERSFQCGTVRDQGGVEYALTQQIISNPEQQLNAKKSYVTQFDFVTDTASVRPSISFGPFTYAERLYISATPFDDCSKITIIEATKLPTSVINGGARNSTFDIGNVGLNRTCGVPFYWAIEGKLSSTDTTFSFYKNLQSENVQSPTCGVPHYDTSYFTSRECCSSTTPLPPVSQFTQTKNCTNDRDYWLDLAEVDLLCNSINYITSTNWQLDDTENFCGRSTFELLTQRSIRRPWRELAHAFITALLNKEDGADRTPIQDELVNAEMFLKATCSSQNSDTVPDLAIFEETTEKLNLFNEGLLGISTCSSPIPTDCPCFCTSESTCSSTPPPDIPAVTVINHPGTFTTPVSISPLLAFIESTCTTCNTTNTTC